MKVDAYVLRGIWSSALRGLPSRRASFFVTSLIGPGIFWLLGAALAGMARPISLLGLAGLAGLGVLGVASAWLQVRWKSRGTSAKPSSRTVASVHQAYYSCAILLLSFYCLILALQAALRVKGPFYVSVIVLYVLSAGAGMWWAPRSMPRKPQDETLAARREIRWLPWVIGLQGGLTSLGVFLGVWAARGSGAWAYFLVLGLGTLLSLMTVTLGLAIAYRFAVLLFSPIPVEALRDAGVRP